MQREPWPLTKDTSIILQSTSFLLCPVRTLQSHCNACLVCQNRLLVRHSLLLQAPDLYNFWCTDTVIPARAACTCSNCSLCWWGSQDESNCQTWAVLSRGLALGTEGMNGRQPLSHKALLKSESNLAVGARRYHEAAASRAVTSSELLFAAPPLSSSLETQQKAR